MYTRYGTTGVVCEVSKEKLLLDEGKVEYFKNLCSEIAKRYWFDGFRNRDHVTHFLGATHKIYSVKSNANYLKNYFCLAYADVKILTSSTPVCTLHFMTNA